MKVQGTIVPIKDRVMVTDMQFGMERTTSGIYIPSDDGKTQGIHPRWARVWAIGPEQQDVNVGDWICIEHGRWSRGITVEQDDGTEITVHMVDVNAIMMISDKKPEDVFRAEA
jgi:co-chaperonin GroES (HSP10)